MVEGSEESGGGRDGESEREKCFEGERATGKMKERVGEKKGAREKERAGEKKEGILSRLCKGTRSVRARERV